MGFQEKLNRAAQTNRSLLGVGLDPDFDRLPAAVRREPDPVFSFNKMIIDATADLVSCYKPQIAFYEALGISGLASLQKTMEHIRSKHSRIPVILDMKRSDVRHTNEAYAKAAYGFWKADAVTVMAYMGLETIEPFCAGDDRYAIVVVRSSNPGAKDLQDLPVLGPQSSKLSPQSSVLSPETRAKPLYQVLAEKIASFHHKNVGAVVGATYPEELKAVREILPGRVILIPGIGAQGGDLGSSVKNGTDKAGANAVIAASRSILYASSGADFADAARKEAEKLRDSIQDAL